MKKFIFSQTQSSKGVIMNKSNTLEELGKKDDKSEEIAEKVIEDPDLLLEIFQGLSPENKRIKNRSAKILRIVSGKNPEIVYPKISVFIDLIDGKDTILKWIAIDVIGNLAPVDTENQFTKIFKKFYTFLSDESMITAGHVIDNSGKIARAKPELSKKITTELLKVEKIPRNNECKNILLGKVILAFDLYFDQIEDKEKIHSFVQRQLENPRNATRLKAEKFLKKHLKEST